MKREKFDWEKQIDELCEEIRNYTRKLSPRFAESPTIVDEEILAEIKDKEEHRKNISLNVNKGILG
jgi:hypothetical protein